MICIVNLFDLGLKLSDLVNELSSVIDKYYSIGIQLQISEEILKKIEKDHAETDRRFIEVLSHWLNNGDTVTWDTVISVLESPLVGRKTLATTLREKYTKSTTTQGKLKFNNCFGETNIHSYVATW